MGMEANIETLLNNLARCVMARKRPRRVALLLDLAAKQMFRTPLSKAMLSGIAPDLARLRREPPQRFSLLNEEPVLPWLLDAVPNNAFKEISEGLRLVLACPGKLGFTPPPPVAALTPRNRNSSPREKTSVPPSAWDATNPLDLEPGESLRLWRTASGFCVPQTVLFVSNCMA